MKLSSIQLNAFYAVAQMGSFSKAADKLNITQSALSQRILNLEHELGTALFIRDSSGLKNTETGNRLLMYCQSQFALENEFLENLGAETGGILRIAGISSVMRSIILEKLVPLLNSNPKLGLDFKTRELNELEPALRSGATDYIISTTKIEKADLECFSIYTEENVLVQKKGYKGPRIYLDHDEHDQTTFEYLKSTKIQRRFLDDIYGIIDGVKLGLGLAVVPAHLIKNHKDIEVIEPHKKAKCTVYVHYFAQSYYTKLHHNFIDSLK